MHKNIFLIFILLVVSCFCMGCSKTKNPIVLPNSDEIYTINIKALDASEITYSDSEWITHFMSVISQVQVTNKSSVQDFPLVENFGTIDILYGDKLTTLYYYEENGTHYIEQPYQGIYKTDFDINALIMGVE